MGADISTTTSMRHSPNFLPCHLLKFKPFFATKSIIYIGLILLVFLLLLIIPSRATAAEEYRFERMWPTLQQPWYFYYPSGIAVAGDDSVYVADTGNHRIQKFSSHGQFVAKWGSKGEGNGEFFEPNGIAIDSSGYIYVADTGNHRIQKFTSDGQFVTKWGSYGGGNGEFAEPSGIAIDSSGHVYVADTENHRIQKFSSDGQFVSQMGKSGRWKRRV